MKVYIEHTKELKSERLQYVLDFIRDHPAARGSIDFCLEWEKNIDAKIAFGINSSSDFSMPYQGNFIGNKKNILPSSRLHANVYEWLNMELYSVESMAQEERVDFFGQKHFAFDVFDTIFFHISRFEERFARVAEKNSLGMIDNHKLFLPENKIEQIPVVDWLVYAFLNCIGCKVEALESQYQLTHDIDKIYKFNNFKEVLKGIFWPLLIKGNFRWSFNNFKYALCILKGKKKDPYDSYDFLFDHADTFVNKTVYFMGGGKSRYDLYDKNYERKLPEIIQKAKDAGYEIGIHPSFCTVDDENRMRKEKSHLEKISKVEITRSRQHFLHYYFGITDHIIDRLAFNIDSTLSYTRMIGFRCGSGFPYKLYDFENEKAFRFIEEPLVVMDSSLIHQSNDDPDKFERILNDFVNKNRQLTFISFNFHNSSFDPTLKSRGRLRDIYIKLLKTIAKH